MKALPFGGQSI